LNLDPMIALFSAGGLQYPGNVKPQNPLITNVGAYLCGSDIQMIQKRFPDPEDFQE
jgi:hypothetical protein